MQERVKNQVLITVFMLLTALAYIGNIHFMLASDLPVNLVTTSMIVDLGVFVPLFFYWLLYRNGIASAFWIKPLVIGGLATAIFILPDSLFINTIKTYYPFLVASVAVVFTSLMVLRVYLANKRAINLVGEQKINFLTRQALGKSWLSDLMRAEWLTFHYFKNGWSKAAKANDQTSYSYHNKSGARGLIFGITAFHIPGLIFTHIVITQLWPVAAVLLTALHLYSMYFFLAQANAMQHRLIEVRSGALYVYCGLLFENCVSLSMIDRIDTTCANDFEKLKDRVQMSLFGYANIKIVLKEPHSWTVLAGVKKSAKEVIIGVDEPHKFISAIQNEMQNNTDSGQ